MLNGLTEAETDATASVAGLRKRPVLSPERKAKIMEAVDRYGESMRQVGVLMVNCSHNSIATLAEVSRLLDGEA